jgi:ABC-type transport system substrate-binding protein
MSHSSRPSTFSCSLTTPCYGLMLNFVPDLAESWEILENSKVYVFHLCKAVTFRDGTDFDAEAVRWNYRRVVDAEEKTLDAAYYNIVDAVEVLDAHSVKFTFKHATRTVLPVMAADRVGFLRMSPSSYQQAGKEEVPAASGGHGAVQARQVGAKPGHRAGEKSPLLQARAPLSRPPRVAHHEGGGDAGDGAAGG